MWLLQGSISQFLCAQSNLYMNISNCFRYDPSVGEKYDLEFFTQAIGGHFWKVEAGSNGSVWALGKFSLFLFLVFAFS